MNRPSAPLGPSLALPACLLPCLVLGLLLGSCSPGSKRLEKAHRSVVWVAAGSEVTFGDLAILDGVGLGELFVEAGRLSWSGQEVRIEELPLLSMPRRTGVTLVVAGSWPRGEREPAAVAAALATELARLGRQSEARGLVPLGFHFDIDAGGALASYGGVLAALQQELAENLYLSASVARPWLGDPALTEVARAVDFLVPFLYGQRPGERDDGDAWDLRQMDTALRRLEELDRDYLIGVVTLGRVFHLDRGGQQLAETTGVGLGELVRNPQLELGMGFSLEGIDRLVYSFGVNGSTRVGEWQLRRGQTVRAVGLAGYHLEELDRRVGASPLEHCLGSAYYRLALAGEGFSLSLENLVNALAPVPAVAAPQVRLEEVAGSGRGRLLVRLVLENANDERTEVLPTGRYNYVQLKVEGASIGRVALGDFRRYDTLVPDRRGELVRAFRNVPILHLYTPVLEGHERLVSGTVEVVLQSAEPRLSLGGEFVVPGGNIVGVTPAPVPEAEAEGGEGR